MSVGSSIFKTVEKEVRVPKQPMIMSPDDDDLLVPLVHPQQYSRLAYPPSCPVVHTDVSSSSSLQQPKVSVIHKAFIRLDTRETLYQIKVVVATLGLVVGEPRNGNNNNGMMMVPESELQFGRGARVWATTSPDGGDRIAGTVLNAYVGPKDNHKQKREVLYSVETEDGGSGSVIHFCSLVQYRATAVAALAPPTPKQEEDESSPAERQTRNDPLALAAHDEETSKPVVVSRNGHDDRSGDGDEAKLFRGTTSGGVLEGVGPMPASGQDSNQEQGTTWKALSPTTIPTLVSRRLDYTTQSNISDLTTTTAESSRVELSPPLERASTPGATNDGSSLAAAHNDDTPPCTTTKSSTKRRSALQQQPDEDCTTKEIVSKRPKLEDDTVSNNKSRHTFVLPMWMDVKSVKGCFSPNKERLETETNCKLDLRASAVEACRPSKPAYKLSVEVEGDDDSILPAFRRLEDLFRGLLDNRGTKALFMYSVARSNQHYYGHEGNYVYQRTECEKDVFRFRWNVFIDLPEQATRPGRPPRGEIPLLGNHGREISTLRGDTPCHLTVVSEWPRSGVLISGDKPWQIDDCIQRVWARVAQLGL